MKEFWFKPHAYGLGAAPSTWEGWAVIAAYVAANAALWAWLALDVVARLPEFFIGVALLTAALIIVAWRKTEGGWRWRWGDPD